MDKKNGKEKEYFKNGRLRFNGECKFGYRWNGKGYNTKNNIVYKLEMEKEM